MTLERASSSEGRTAQAARGLGRWQDEGFAECGASDEGGKCGDHRLRRVRARAERDRAVGSRELGDGVRPVPLDPDWRPAADDGAPSRRCPRRCGDRRSPVTPTAPAAPAPGRHRRGRSAAPARPRTAVAASRSGRASHPSGLHRRRLETQAADVARTHRAGRQGPRSASRWRPSRRSRRPQLLRQSHPLSARAGCAGRSRPRRRAGPRRGRCSSRGRAGRAR